MSLHDSLATASAREHSDTAVATVPVDELLAEGLRLLPGLSAEERVGWALAQLPGRAVLSSSFGAQSAVLLHMVTRWQADIPVVLVDTGYLFAETYRFIDQLTERLALNLVVARPQHSAAWLQARHGQLWAQGLPGLERYNRLHKVEPMQRALAELHCGTWIAGLRRAQSGSRAELAPLDRVRGRYKLHPLYDWSDRQIGRYLSQHQLPYHPLWEQGYVSIGDTHSTRPLQAGMLPEQTRFHGLKRECGLHEELAQ